MGLWLSPAGGPIETHCHWSRPGRAAHPHRCPARRRAPPQPAPARSAGSGARAAGSRSPSPRGGARAIRKQTQFEKKESKLSRPTQCKIHRGNGPERMAPLWREQVNSEKKYRCDFRHPRTTAHPPQASESVCRDLSIVDPAQTPVRPLAGPQGKGRSLRGES